MLTVAAYRFETPNADAGEVETWWRDAIAVVDAWLSDKGVSDASLDSGTFESQTKGASGEFKRLVTSNAAGSIHAVTLSEPTDQGYMFITNSSVVRADGHVSFYLTMSVENTGASLAPITVYPRCPALVRNMLGLRSDWVFGGSEVPPPKPITLSGNKSAATLSGYLMNPARTLPVTVVSELEGQPVWADLPEKLAVDLAGLSAVVMVDADASWELNKLLGKNRSCYLGAVRVYWPLSRATTEPSDLVSNLWTAERLLSNDSDAKGMARFTTALRRRVMHTAALAFSAPTSIRQILSESSRQRLARLQEKVDANSEEIELARLFIRENESLKDELEKAKIEAARQAARAETAEYAIEQLKAGKSQDDGVEEGNAISEPAVGEVRYYKKTHSKPSYDVLVRICDCGHNAWQASNKADKAKKGIARLEGSDKWESVYHCASCHGGGVWKVTW